MTKLRLAVPALTLLLAACGGGPRQAYAPPLPPERGVPEKPRPSYVKPSPPLRGPDGVAPAASVPPALAGPLTVARLEPYMDALEMDLRRHVHERGIVTARRGNDIAITIEDSLLFTPDGGVMGDNVLEPLASLLRGYAHVSVAVNGYTDTAGPPERNLIVSLARARAIAAALVHEGVAAGRISAQGFGETHLRIMTGDDKNEPRNRRIEIVLKAAPG